MSVDLAQVASLMEMFEETSVSFENEQRERE
jgi:hypothetical protein